MNKNDIFYICGFYLFKSNKGDNIFGLAENEDYSDYILVIILENDDLVVIFPTNLKKCTIPTTFNIIFIYALYHTIYGIKRYSYTFQNSNYFEQI